MARGVDGVNHSRARLVQLLLRAETLLKALRNPDSHKQQSAVFMLEVETKTARRWLTQYRRAHRQINKDENG